MPAGCEFTLWRPKLTEPIPPGMTGAAAALVWSAFHALRIFRNRDYGVVLVHCGNTLVHRSYLFPGYFRFPFMSRDDLQVGATWTDETWRGLGIASAALEFAVRSNGRLGRTFWYLTYAENAASVKVVERCGFVRRSGGRRTSRLGLRLLGAYIPD